MAPLGTSGYRDELAAAHARIATLERKLDAVTRGPRHRSRVRVGDGAQQGQGAIRSDAAPKSLVRAACFLLVAAPLAGLLAGLGLRYGWPPPATKRGALALRYAPATLFVVGAIAGVMSAWFLAFVHVVSRVSSGAHVAPNARVRIAAPDVGASVLLGQIASAQQLTADTLATSAPHLDAVTPQHTSHHG